MDGQLIGALLIGVAFGSALLIPAVAAYRGQYRSWIYRGFGTRYGAFAVGGIGSGVMLMTLAAVIGSDAEPAYSVVGGCGFGLLVAGLIGFAWMPRALLPAWRRERLANARLYRSGSDAARLTSTTIELTGDRLVALYRRSAPVVDSEYVAFSATGMAVRPRLRRSATLAGALPDRLTGAPTDVITTLRGDLIADADLVLFVQEPEADAQFVDNWFAVIPGPPDPPEVSDSASGATWTLTSAQEGRSITITVPNSTATDVSDDLRSATRPRRYRRTIHGELIR